MNDHPKREVALFAEALQLPIDERSAFLERGCGDDAQLRQRVEGLLRSHDSAGDFLEKPPLDVLESGPEPSAGQTPGDRIGRYKLLEQIGVGGCGVVYLAEQEEPVRRRVALKVIKPGMDTKSVIARFEAERQALALMDHSSIAKVFDAGATQSGHPYFVMELARGVKITDYCDQNALTTEERLGLFVQVCRAIQHAHQKGIIHRDIKPSNILVSKTEEGEVLPVVIDFGIAKATTNQRLTDPTVFTAFEMLIGTPAYMSPEQAELGGVDVDTRTDIYSLGVLLYELLTGSTPFDSGTGMKAGLDEIRRVIRERDPVRPSTRLSAMTAGDLTTIAQRRHSAPANLIRSIRGDLDWIVMKALEKDRSRRYETANGLAMEVQRHLANEPVLARPPSTIYKFRKLAVRNKLLFGAISVITIVLFVSLFVVTVSLGRARTEAEKSGQITEFLKEMLKGVGPSAARGRDTVMLREILDRTAARIGKDMGRQPAVEAELRSLIGRLYLEIGEPGEAEKMHRAALTINRKLFGAASKEAAASLNDLGFVFWSEGHTLADAERSFQEALTIRRQIFGNTNLDVAISLNHLANVYRQQGKLDASEMATQEALQIWQKLSKSESLNAADSLLNLCILRGDRGRWIEAEELARKVLAIRRRELGDDDILVAKSLADVAWAAGANGKLAEAESLEREALALRRKLLSEQHPDVAKSLYLVGDRLRQEGKKLDEAHALLSEALSKQRKLGEEETRDMLDSMRSLGLILEAEGKLVEAETLHREALVLWRKRHEIATPQAQWQLECLVRVLVAQEKLADAEQILDEILTPETLRNPSIIRALDLRIDLMARQGQWEKAAADAALALELQPTDQNRFHALAPLLVITHNHPGYEQLRRQVLTTFAGTTDPLVADRMAKDCLLLPCSDTELRKIDRLADIAVGAGEEASRRNEYLRLSLPFFQTCKASSEYRQGRFAESVVWAQKVVESSQLYAKAQAYSILALAQWRLGHTETARGALAEADRSIMHICGQRNDQGGWLALIFARLWLEEANQLINSEEDQGKLPWRERQSQYPQSLSELDRHCHALIVQKKFGDAEKLLDDALTPDLIGKPISADLLALRAGLKARRGRWQEASADASRSHENQPLESGIYSMVAGLLVKTDDRAGYERFCKRIFAATGNTTNIYVADQLAKACLLIPSSEVDLEPIGRLADAVVTLGAGDEGAMPFFQICKALAEYRLGHFAEAGQWAQRSVNNSRKDAQGHAYAILAMADWQLGRKDEARAMLAKGDALAPQDMPTSVAENPGNDWLAWLFARIQLDEAAKLIQPTSTTNAASKKQ